MKTKLILASFQLWHLVNSVKWYYRKWQTIKLQLYLIRTLCYLKKSLTSKQIVLLGPRHSLHVAVDFSNTDNKAMEYNASLASFWLKKPNSIFNVNSDTNRNCFKITCSLLFTSNQERTSLTSVEKEWLMKAKHYLWICKPRVVEISKKWSDHLVKFLFLGTFPI